MPVITSSSTLADIFTADIDMNTLTTEVRSGVITAVGDAFESLLDCDVCSPLDLTPERILRAAIDLTAAKQAPIPAFAQRPLRDEAHAVRRAANEAIRQEYLRGVHVALLSGLQA